MGNLAILLGGIALGLVVVSIMVRFREIWFAIRPQRRGPQDPTWLSGWVGLIAVGALIIGIAAAAHGANQNPNGGVLTAGVVVGALGVIGVFGCVLLAALRLIEDRKSPFEIDHYEGCSECAEDVNTHLGPGRQLRLHVTNNGRGGVQRVRTYLRDVRGAFGSVRDYFLHVTHDNDPSGQRSLSRGGEYLTVFQDVHFDLVLVIQSGDDAHRQARIRFEYADPAISQMSTFMVSKSQLPQKWSFVVEVSGWTDFRDVAPRFRKCELVVDADGLPELTLL